MPVLAQTDRAKMKDLESGKYPVFNHKTIVIVGGFGSGKTEVSVNIAKFLVATQEIPVGIVDFDLVNPYFRSREVTEEMAKLGIDVVLPTGPNRHADLPILMPEIKGIIENPRGYSVLDVGGDAQGTRALGSLSSYFKPGEYEMLMVLNSRRPQTDSLEGCLKAIARIEAAAHLRFSGIISNSHMIDETEEDVILEGYQLSQAVATATGLTLRFVSAKHNILEKIDPNKFACPVLPMTRLMLKPWERPESAVGEN